MCKKYRKKSTAVHLRFLFLVAIVLLTLLPISSHSKNIIVIAHSIELTNNFTKMEQKEDTKKAVNSHVLDKVKQKERLEERVTGNWEPVLFFENSSMKIDDEMSLNYFFGDTEITIANKNILDEFSFSQGTIRSKFSFPNLMIVEKDGNNRNGYYKDQNIDHVYFNGTAHSSVANGYVATPNTTSIAPLHNTDIVPTYYKRLRPDGQIDYKLEFDFFDNGKLKVTQIMSPNPKEETIDISVSMKNLGTSERELTLVNTLDPMLAGDEDSPIRYIGQNKGFYLENKPDLPNLTRPDKVYRLNYIFDVPGGPANWQAFEYAMDVSLQKKTIPYFFPKTTSIGEESNNHLPGSLALKEGISPMFAMKTQPQMVPILGTIDMNYKIGMSLGNQAPLFTLDQAGDTFTVTEGDATSTPFNGTWQDEDSDSVSLFHSLNNVKTNFTPDIPNPILNQKHLWRLDLTTNDLPVGTHKIEFWAEDDKSGLSIPQSATIIVKPKPQKATLKIRFEDEDGVNLLSDDQEKEIIKTYDDKTFIPDLIAKEKDVRKAIEDIINNTDLSKGKYRLTNPQVGENLTVNSPGETITYIFEGTVHLVNVSSDMRFKDGYVSTAKQSLPYDPTNDFVLKVTDTRSFNQSIRGNFAVSVKILGEGFETTLGEKPILPIDLIFTDNQNQTKLITNKYNQIYANKNTSNKDIIYNIYLDGKQTDSKGKFSLNVEPNSVKKASYHTELMWDIVQGP